MSKGEALHDCETQTAADAHMLAALGPQRYGRRNVLRSQGTHSPRTVPVQSPYSPRTQSPTQILEDFDTQPNI